MRRGGRLKYHTAEQRQSARKRQRVEARERGKKEREENPLATRADVGIEQPVTIIVPPEVMAEAKLAYSWLGRRSVTAELQGDPLPGRSALDLKRAAHEGYYGRPYLAVSNPGLGRRL
jgi:hypothetical protein